MCDGCLEPKFILMKNMSRCLECNCLYCPKCYETGQLCKLFSKKFNGLFYCSNECYNKSDNEIGNKLIVSLCNFIVEVHKIPEENALKYFWNIEVN